MTKTKEQLHFEFKRRFASIPRREYTKKKKDVASKMGIRPKDLDLIIRGEAEPTLEQLAVLARCFGLDPESLGAYSLTGSKPAHNNNEQGLTLKDDSG